MNELVKMKLFRLLSESSQVTNEEMQSAYGCFMKRVETVSQSELDYWENFRMLNNTRINLVFIETLNRYEQGENALKFAYLQKALNSVNSELRLLNLRIRYPEQFRPSNQPTFQSDLYIVPKSKGLGINWYCRDCCLSFLIRGGQRQKRQASTSHTHCKSIRTSL